MAALLRTELYSDLSPVDREALFAHSSLNLKEIRTKVIEPLAAEFQKGSFAALRMALQKFEGGVPAKLLFTRDCQKRRPGKRMRLVQGQMGPVVADHATRPH